MKKTKKRNRRNRRNSPPLWWMSLSETSRTILTTSAGLRAGDTREKCKTTLRKASQCDGIRSLLMMQPNCTYENVDEIFDALWISEFHIPQTCPICARRQLGKSLAEYLLPLVREMSRLLKEKFEKVKKVKTAVVPPSGYQDAYYNDVVLPIWDEIAMCDSIEKYLEGTIAAAIAEYSIYPRGDARTIFLKINPPPIDLPLKE